VTCRPISEASIQDSTDTEKVCTLWIMHCSGKHHKTWGLMSFAPFAKSASRFCIADKKIQTSWPLVRKRTIPTERPLLVGKI
jgi:hypothetical protein